MHFVDIVFGAVVDADADADAVVVVVIVVVVIFVVPPLIDVYT